MAALEAEYCGQLRRHFRIDELLYEWEEAIAEDRGTSDFHSQTKRYL